MAQNVRLHPEIRERLKTLPGQLKSEFGLSATQEEIVAALVHGTTIPQLAGMLLEFNRYTVGRSETGTETEDEKTRV